MESPCCDFTRFPPSFNGTSFQVHLLTMNFTVQCLLGRKPTQTPSSLPQSSHFLPQARKIPQLGHYFKRCPRIEFHKLLALYHVFNLYIMRIFFAEKVPKIEMRIIYRDPLFQTRDLHFTWPGWTKRVHVRYQTSLRRNFKTVRKTVRNAFQFRANHVLFSCMAPFIRLC